MNFRIQKRKKNDFILVATTRLHAQQNKNILTVWTHNNKIDIRIMPDEPESYRTLSDFNDTFVYKLKRYIQG